MPNPVRDVSRFEKWLDHLLQTGMGGDRIYESIRAYAVLIEEKTGRVQEYLSRSRVRDYVRSFRSNLKESIASLPNRRSDWLKEGMAQLVKFDSPTGNKYHLTFNFSAVNVDTLEVVHLQATLGLKNTIRWGDAQDRMQQIAYAMISNPEFYKLAMGNYEIMDDSFKVATFTRNR